MGQEIHFLRYLTAMSYGIWLDLSLPPSLPPSLPSRLWIQAMTQTGETEKAFHPEAKPALL